MRLLLLFVLLVVARFDGQAAERVDYLRDVTPVLSKYCGGCHSADEPESGLVLESHQGLLAGGESGDVVTPGSAESSRLWLMAAGKLEPAMPPEGEEGLTAEELELLAAWIDQGALGPTGPLPLKRRPRVPEIDRLADAPLPVTAIAFSPDGQLRAIARYGEIVLLRRDESEALTMSTELDKVNALQFSRDGTQILAASGMAGVYGSAALFSVASGELIGELVGHRDAVYAARFSPDGTKVATAGYDRAIILWDLAQGRELHRFEGHHGAVFDLAFSPDGKVLVSACADETAKVWSVETGQRLDTLSQPEGEVFAVEVTPDGKFVVAASADNRVRVWRLLSIDRPQINPLVATRFVDESPLVNFALTPDAQSLVILSQAGNLKLVRTSDWRQIGALQSLPDVGSDLAVSPDSKTVFVALMNGQIVERNLPAPTAQEGGLASSARSIYLELGPPAKLEEQNLSKVPVGAKRSDQQPVQMDVARGVEIVGAISAAGESDRYRWRVGAGEVWAIDADPIDNSPIDPIVTILDEQGEPVLRTRLQATRDTYFTFRGKDSETTGDFRLFNWQEMGLNEFLYAGGEVTRLAVHPRGPDSGFLVYPREGKRWTYFGTTHTAHALGDPAYIVRSLQPGEQPAQNGLPTFDVYFENDDDPMRLAGRGSRLLFTAPVDGSFTVRIADTRNAGGDDYKYRLKIRAAKPTFQPSIGQAHGTLRRGVGREFEVRVDRLDGFDGPVTFDSPDLPPEIVANLPLTIEAGQRKAQGTLWVPETAKGWDGKVAAHLVAYADIAGRRVERRVGKLGEFELGDPPRAVPVLQPIDGTVAEDENWTLRVRRGHTAAARVVVQRQEGFDDEISFGGEGSGRNAAHGVYVDNIGLNGLRIVAKAEQREFFLTADPTAAPGRRSFFLTADVDDKVTTHPITVEVLP